MSTPHFSVLILLLIATLLISLVDFSEGLRLLLLVDYLCLDFDAVVERFLRRSLSYLFDYDRVFIDSLFALRSAIFREGQLLFFWV